MTTLYEQMRETIRLRDEKHALTDTRALRTFLEFADHNKDNATMSRWLTPGPDMEADSDWSAWLNPQGQWYFFNYAEHYYFASSAFGHGNSYLEKRGWLHVSGGEAYAYYAVTPRQQRALDACPKPVRIVEMSEESKRSEGYPQFPISLDTEEGTDEQIARIRAFSRMPIPNYKWDDPKYWPNPEHGHPAVLAALSGSYKDTPSAGLRIPTWDIEANAMRWQPAA